EHHARRAPDRVLARCGSETVTYGEMAARSAALAAGFGQRGVEAGTVVALLSYNRVEVIETIFAANHIRAIALPITLRLAAPEVRYIPEHSEARALVCDPELLALADDATSHLAIERVAITDDPRVGWTSFAGLRASAEQRAPRARSAGDDIHRLMYTSG